MLQELSLTQFVKYAAAPPIRRRPVIGQMIGGDGYSPARDFYLGMRRALASDRRTTRDGRAVDAAVTNANDRKRARYASLAAMWSQMSPRWENCTPVPVDRSRRITTGGLTLRVPAPFVEQHPDGTWELVVVRLPEAELDSTVVDMILRIYQRTYAPEQADAVITFVDLTRGNLRTSTDRDLSGLDLWIETDAAELAYALRNAA